MRRFAAVALALSLSGCTRVFFQPTREAHAPLEQLKSLGLPYEEVRFTSGDGTPLAGLFLPARARPVKGTVVHFHGNGQNMTAHFTFVYWLTGYGFNVFAFDYRGYGASGGAPSLKGAVEDGMAAVRCARGRPDVDPARVVVLGQSLGGALAVAALARLNGGGVRALALEGSFAAYAGVAQDKLARFFLTWPIQWPLSRLLFSSRYDAARHIARLAGIPLAVIHGDADPIVPFREGERLYAKAGEPKEFWRVAGGGHTEAFTRYGQTYRPKLAEFFARALAR